MKGISDYDNIPCELKDKLNWVNVWNNSKVPMRVDHMKAASASNQQTWGSFSEAVTNVQHGQYDGIGYVFDGDGLVGIDIDAGFDESGFLTTLAADIVSRCKSYTEKSRSGRGVHILLRGDLPFRGKNNHAAVEIYKSNRYFIMTGQVLLYREIVENQAAIDYVLDKYFPDTAKEKTSAAQPQQRIYSPVYRRPENGKLQIRPEYPPIEPGSRNLCLTSLAGQLHNVGYTKREIYCELLHANEKACKPPLHRNEIELIVNSVARYTR